jgi:hypothetical protein
VRLYRVLKKITTKSLTQIDNKYLQDEEVQFAKWLVESRGVNLNIIELAKESTYKAEDTRNVPNNFNLLGIYL